MCQQRLSGPLGVSHSPPRCDQRVASLLHRLGDHLIPSDQLAVSCGGLCHPGEHGDDAHKGWAANVLPHEGRAHLRLVLSGEYGVGQGPPRIIRLRFPYDSPPVYPEIALN